MWDLSQHEKFEIETLTGLNSIKALDQLIFCGGTMLRLCHDLNRYSVDLDFWLTDTSPAEKIFKEIKAHLTGRFRIRHAAMKSKALVFEFTSLDYPRSLKIEIRTDKKKVKSEEKIAYSRHSDRQVFLKAATLDEMLAAKVETFVDRCEIRDAFDLEFLLRRGMRLKAAGKNLERMKKIISRFKPHDYRVSLGALLEFKERQYYQKARFKFLLEKIEERLNK